MTVAKLEQLFNNKSSPKASKIKSFGGGADFGGMLDAVGAMGPAVGTTAQMYGNTTSASVLAAAFSGIGAASAQSLGGSGVPSYAGGYSGGANLASTGGTLGGLDSGAAVVPGTEGFSQMDMINSMNQNNLQLLELQATMQSNMQGWNTKSNILSADHRARMAMIEKFTARG